MKIPVLGSPGLAVHVQRLALVDAAAWLLSEPDGGEEFAYTLLVASCAAEVIIEHVYLALITPSGKLDEDREAPAISDGFRRTKVPSL
jgi:hypothetical protein